MAGWLAGWTTIHGKNGLPSFFWTSSYFIQAGRVCFLCFVFSLDKVFRDGGVFSPSTLIFFSLSSIHPSVRLVGLSWVSRFFFHNKRKQQTIVKYTRTFTTIYEKAHSHFQLSHACLLCLLLPSLSPSLGPLGLFFSNFLDRKICRTRAVKKKGANNKTSTAGK